jgi:hypothetical protein
MTMLNLFTTLLPSSDIPLGNSGKFKRLSVASQTSLPAKRCNKADGKPGTGGENVNSHMQPKCKHTQIIL